MSGVGSSEENGLSRFHRTDSEHARHNSSPSGLDPIGKSSLSALPPISSASPNEKSGLTCAVVTPIGPGHQELYQECLATIEQAIQTAIKTGTGPFNRFEVIAIDDTRGELGRSRARNDGVRESLRRGADWIFFLDADDFLHDAVFEEFRPYTDKYDAVWGTIVEIEQGSAVPKLRMPQLLSIETEEELLLFDPFLTLQMGHFVRADIAARFPFNESMETGEDFEYYLRLWNHCRCVKAPVNFFINRRGQHSTGPRAADGNAWTETVNAVVEQQKQRLGFSIESARTIEIRNRCVETAQKQTRSAPHKLDYFTMSRSMPWRGYFEVSHFEHAGFVMFSDNDDLVSLSLGWTGAYEPTSTRIWQALAVGCEVILDIGAYTGLYSFLAARAEPNAFVMGFEPLSQNHSRFVMNRNLNKLPHVHPVRAAVSDVSGSVKLATFSGGDFLTSGASIVQDHKGQADEIEAVRAITIDNFLRNNSLAMPGLIKIDVEGAELNVLRGMQQTLTSSHPDILIECLEGADTHALTELLEPVGYNFFAIDEESRNIGQTESLVAGNRSSNANRIASTRSLAEIADLCTRKSQRRKSSRAEWSRT